MFAYYPFGRKHGYLQLKLICDEFDSVVIPYRIAKLLLPKPANVNIGVQSNF